jgi:4'-phosphopantetheinyl transferase
MGPICFGVVEQPWGQLPPATIHVYTTTLNASEEQFWGDLTATEQVRADKFRIPRIRQQFIHARGQLRRLLGSYLACDSVHVPILVADGGKPYLPAETGIHFNVSHTDGLAVYALARHDLGIDIERIRPVPDALNLVKRFFCPREIDLFHQLPEPAILPAFFKAWTRKEAVLKALGRGVQSLDCCEVTFLDEEPPQVIRLDEQPGHAWRLHTWTPTAGFQAALAWQSPVE